MSKVIKKAYAEEMKQGLDCFLAKRLNMSGDELAAERYERFRRM